MAAERLRCGELAACCCKTESGSLLSVVQGRTAAQGLVVESIYDETGWERQELVSGAARVAGVLCTDWEAKASSARFIDYIESGRVRFLNPETIYGDRGRMLTVNAHWGRVTRSVYDESGRDADEDRGDPTGGLLPGVFCGGLGWVVTVLRHMGTWIDQLVATEVDTDHDGVVETTLYPVTDLLGSVQLLTDASGKIVERVEYDADGTPRFFSGDAVAPTVTRVAWTGDGVRPTGDVATAAVFEIGFSEWIDEASVATASATLTADGGSATSLTVTLDDGARSAALSGGAVVAGSGYTLRLDGLKDRGGNAMAALELPVSVADEAVYEVLSDTVAPKVLAVMDADDGVYVVFDEPVVVEAGGSLVDAVTVSRSGADVPGSTSRVSANVVRWAANDALAWLDLGVYSVTAVALADTSAAGNAVDATPLPVSFMHLADDVDRNLVVYEASGDSQSRADSAYGVTSLFQGRGWHQDLELYYYRARWYAPEAGVFAERDPAGFEDGSNSYQPLGWTAPNAVDPTGRTIIFLWFGAGSEYYDREGMRLLSDGLVAHARANGIPFQVTPVNSLGEKTSSQGIRSQGYVDSDDDLEIYALSGVSRDRHPIIDAMMKLISESPYEKVVHVGHSHGARAARDFSEEMGDLGRSVDLLVLIDQVPGFISRRLSIPGNVRELMAFYVKPTEETRKANKDVQPPISGFRKFKFEGPTRLYSLMPIDAVHTDIDNHPTVQSMTLQRIIQKHAGS